MKQKIPSQLIVLGIAYGTYVVLGLSNGLLGVAWPSIQGTFGLPLDSVGVLIFVSTLGYTACSLLSGRLVYRFGIRAFLILCALSAAGGLAFEAGAPAWWVMVAVALLVGFGLGGLDSGLNIYVAPRFSAGALNGLHAFYGIGTTIGPAFMTALLQAGLSWRLGYTTVSAVNLLPALVILLTGTLWRAAGPQKPVSTTPGVAKTGSKTSHSMLVWIYIILFFFITGAEVTAGQWAFVLFTQSRHVPELLAGSWVSGYWFSFTLSRVLMGWAADRLGVVRTILISLGGTLAGLLLLWWNPTNTIGFAGLLLFGFSLGPTFPTLISHTPRLLGEREAANAIGYMVASASISAGILPGLAGVLARNLGIELVSPFVLVLCAVAFLLFLSASRAHPNSPQVEVDP